MSTPHIDFFNASHTEFMVLRFTMYTPRPRMSAPHIDFQRVSHGIFGFAFRLLPKTMSAPCPRMSTPKHDLGICELLRPRVLPQAPFSFGPKRVFENYMCCQGLPELTQSSPRASQSSRPRPSGAPPSSLPCSSKGGRGNGIVNTNTYIFMTLSVLTVVLAIGGRGCCTQTFTTWWRLWRRTRR